MKHLLLTLAVLLILLTSTSNAAQHSKINGFDKGTFVTKVMLGTDGPYKVQRVSSYNKYPKRINLRTYAKITYYQPTKIIVYRFNQAGQLLSGAIYKRVNH